MDSWLVKALDERRQTRRLAALARETDIAPQRLQRIARSEAEPEADELKRLTEALRPAPAPSAPETAAKPAPAPAPATAAAPASSPAPAAPAAAPTSRLAVKPVSAPVAVDDLGRMKLPVQGDTADFAHRQKLIDFARQIRDWPQKRPALRPGDMARLQVLWNDVQAAIAAINIRIWGKPEGPGTPAGLGPGKKRKTHHSLRFLFKQAAEEKLPRAEIDELSRIARDAVTEGAANGFLDGFAKAAKAVLDEEDFQILLDKAVAAAGPSATPQALLADLEDEGEEEADETEGTAEAGAAENESAEVETGEATPPAAPEAPKPEGS